MNTAINFHEKFETSEQEKQALDQLCDYLVYKGKYKNAEAARRDASERVEFLEKADFFETDAELAGASVARKSTLALIQGHDLKSVLAEHDGYLPAMEEEQPASEAVKRPITEIFSSIALDLRTGLSQEQIVHKLVDSGLSADNAEDAIAAVRRQRQQKQKTRLLAAATIIVLALLLFFFAR